MFHIDIDSDYTLFGNWMIPTIIYNYYKDSIPIEKLIEVYDIQRYIV